jgi:hypothetical protein
MRKVTQDEILGLGAYEQIRDRFRARMIEHKKNRRVLLGPEMSLVFEDHDTVLLQVQEMLRTERITDATAVKFELDTYNELVPPDGALLATLMIEVADAEERERKRREYVGLDHAISLEIGERKFVARFAPEGIYPDRIAVVQYLRFDMAPDGHALLADASKKARIVSSHPRYAHSAEVPMPMRESLLRDLDPANAASAATKG